MYWPEKRKGRESSIFMGESFKRERVISGSFVGR